MPAFAIELNKFESAFKFLMKTREKLHEKNSFFSGDLSFHTRAGKIIAYFDLKPKFPNPVYLGLVSMVIYLAFKWGFFLWLGAFFTMAGFLHTEVFFFIMFRWGLLKSGYGGKIKLLGKSAIIRRVMK